MHISGDGLRVVEEDTKGLIVDQTIEKVSFCAPDRNHERGFSYICRDGTTRRWMCHGFLASKDSGERLSHAVGCAFAVCLERKQRRDKECGVTMTFDMKNSTFTRSGSFRAQTFTERLADAPSAIVQPQPQSKTAFNPFAIERPHATPSMLERQGSFRGFTQIGAQSPFKRQMSLRINDLPSNAERQKAFLEPVTPSRTTVSPIPEISPQQIDTVSQLCQELSQGLSLLTRSDTDDFNFNNSTSINQNTALGSFLNSSATSSPTNAGYSQLTSSSSSHYTNPSNISTTVYGGGSVTNALSNLSPTNTNGTIVTSTSSTPTQKVVPIETVAPLPKPDQWLGEIVKKSTSPSPKRPPSIQMHNRTKSLNTSASDPFDAEWVAEIAKPEIRNTNPFISPPKPPAQSFQVQL